jgi:hypothetical protein
MLALQLSQHICLSGEGKIAKPLDDGAHRKLSCHFQSLSIK